MNLENKRALIIGSGGLGAAVTRRFAASGARLLVADLDVDAARRTVDDLPAAVAAQVDVTSRGSVSELFSIAEHTLGGCDVLVYGAGIARHRPLAEVSEEDWARVMAVNLTGAFHCCQEAAHVMARQKSGSIVALASVASSRHGSGTSAYSASKAGLAAFIHAIAVDLAAAGVRANVVDPGPFDTELVRVAHAPTFRGAYERAIPMGRYGRPEELAGAVAYLASDDASYVTGSTLTVDGGFSHAGAIA